MSSKYHFLYIAVILILGILLFRQHWEDYQIEHGMEIMDEINSPLKSELTGEELLEKFRNSEDQIQKIKNSLVNTPKLFWITKSDEKVKLSLFSNKLSDNVELFHTTEVLNLDFLTYYNDVEVRLIQDSLIITSSDSVIAATKDWKVEFEYSEWFHVFRDYLSSENKYLNKIMDQLDNSGVYGIKTIPLDKESFLTLYYFDDNRTNHFIYVENFQKLPEEVQNEKEVLIDREIYETKVVNGRVFLTPGGNLGTVIKTDE